jgi:hypothetical protein
MLKVPVTQGASDFLKPATLDPVPRSPDGYCQGQATALHPAQATIAWRVTGSSRAGKAPANGISQFGHPARSVSRGTSPSTLGRRCGVTMKRIQQRRRSRRVCDVVSPQRSRAHDVSRCVVHQLLTRASELPASQTSELIHPTEISPRFSAWETIASPGRNAFPMEELICSLGPTCSHTRKFIKLTLTLRIN